MAAHLEIAARVEELIDAIDPMAPIVDRERAAERLRAYVQTLGIETIPRVRWLPDPRALHEERAGCST